MELETWQGKPMDVQLISSELYQMPPTTIVRVTVSIWHYLKPASCPKSPTWCPLPRLWASSSRIPLNISISWRRLLMRSAWSEGIKTVHWSRKKNTRCCVRQDGWSVTQLLEDFQQMYEPLLSVWMPSERMKREDGMPRQQQKPMDSSVPSHHHHSLRHSLRHSKWTATCSPSPSAWARVCRHLLP